MSARLATAISRRSPLCAPPSQPDHAHLAGPKGSGARLHWHLCSALLKHAAVRGWQTGESLALILTLQSCTWRAGGFYTKMGWRKPAELAERQRSVSAGNIGGIMWLDLNDREAWSRYWRVGSS